MKCNCSNRPDIRQEFAPKFSEKRFEWIAEKERPIDFLARRRCALFRCRSCGQHWQVDRWASKDGYTSWPELCIRIRSPESWRELDDLELRRSYFPPMVNGVAQPDRTWRKCDTPVCRHPVVVGLEQCANCACRAMHGAARQSRSLPAVTERVKKSTRPTAKNSAVSVLRLWRDVHRAAPRVREYLKKGAAREEHFLQALDIVGTGIAFIQHSRDLMSLALLAAHGGESGWQEQLREAFSLMHWGMEILQHERVARRVGPGEVDGFLLERIWLHGLAAGGSADPIADSTARYLADIIAATGGNGETLGLAADRPYALFIGYLVDANVQGRWPKVVDRMIMRAYGDLLARAPAPEAFRKALVSFCDYRVAHAFGYDGMEATRRRSEDRTESVLDAGGWIRLFPVELFSLQYVYQKTTGKALSLEADHPLLQERFMKLPALLPLYDDDHVRRAVALAKDVYGDAWRPVSQ